VVIKPRLGLAPLDLRLLWQFRDLLWAFAERDIRLRYRQTVLGAAWVVLQPLMGASIFAVVFGVIAKIPSQGVPYFLISYSGLLGWTLFFGTLTRITPSLLANATLVRKVFFPRLLVPLGVVPSVALDFVISLALMIVLLAIYHIAPGPGLVLAPACVLILLAIAVGVGLVAASLAVKYRDVQHIVPFATQLLMYASPVGYSVSAVPARLKVWYFLLNPIAAPIDTLRWSFLGVGQPRLAYLAYSFVIALICLTVGLFAFRGAEREFADVI
jgi:lipopolysaccharide transport system permease protein